MANHAITGKTVLIAGGAKNLGGLLARDLARCGAKAVANHDNSDATRTESEETVTAIGPGPMDTPFFHPAEGEDAVQYHKTAAARSPKSKTGLTDIEDIVPWIRFLVSDGWWMTGQPILVNGGYTTK